MQLTIVPAEMGWGESGCSTGNNAQYLQKKRRKERLHYEQHDIQTKGKKGKKLSLKSSFFPSGYFD